MTTRRQLFGLAVGAAAAPAIAKLDGIAGLLAPPVTPLYAELNAVVRRAFVPTVSVRIYNQHPMLSLVMGKD